ncbi:hypothetical protein PR202_gb26228 [Eleusine coracana subsp. coracana]|uniref:Uncharacterized protein n=1 Tax=Eleusine coracana subsp. coracana TaxID=191504 RepID=A0AAV5FQN7_ELECO|nr:hypothetical protein PR202_gb26228 [Eleusine coracana subsp. coracana]
MELSAASVPHSVCSASYGHHQSSSPARCRRRRRQKHVGLGGRCQAVLKEHKTRLYILGRCVSMLLCWHHHDSD